MERVGRYDTFGVTLVAPSWEETTIYAMICLFHTFIARETSITENVASEKSLAPLVAGVTTLCVRDELVMFIVCLGEPMQRNVVVDFHDTVVTMSGVKST